MASCGACGSTILFGGVKLGNERYCNADCAQRGQYTQLAATVPAVEVQQMVRKMHAGPCPKCKSTGNVDVHNSYFVWSALIMTQWQTKPQVSCRACGVKSQLGYMFSSLLVGWWGLPWGLIMTPIQIGRNLFAIVSPPDPHKPSPALERIARMQLGVQMAHEQAGAR